ncbi:Hsp20/alpha crystallin family protein [Rubritalea sp.]|uniref:Hsp20/alpha crystallin family protein n=1 Tax=Rubritalea sp. TaxID=2109375 RepID=UPI003EF6248D
MSETNTTSPQKSTTLNPRYNTVTHEKGVHIHIDLPGVNKQDISITSEKTQLKISATRENAQPEAWTLLNQVERPSSYQLKLNVHSDFDLSSTTAQLEHGVLKLSLSKREESLPRQINVTD